MRAVGGAELRERARVRRFLLFEVVAGFLAIELHEDLARPDAIA